MFIFALLMTLCIFNQSANSMGLFHQESLNSDLSPTPGTIAAVQAIDTVGDTLGAVGVPFASYAGEVASAVLGIAALLLNVARSRNKKAAVTIVKAVEAATEGGEIKAEILRRAPLDKTFDTIHKLVKEITK
jgi:hypothetical protein